MTRVQTRHSAVAGRPRPLVVDLDDTLLCTDTLVESVVELAFSQPREFLGALPALRHGRAAFKHAVAEHVRLDYATLPYDQKILGFIRHRRTAGGAVYLVTGADRSIAAGVASHLGLFDGVIASDGTRNLKGASKASALVEMLGPDFDYLGDHLADLPVWEAAQQVYVAGKGGAAVRALTRRGIPVVRRFPAPDMSPREWVKALRLHQWSKNLLLFVSVFLGQEFGDGAVVSRVMLGFLTFGLVASATYLLNDIKDLSADRRHFGKRHRAMASGRLSLQSGFALALVLLLVGIAGGFALMPAFGLVLVGYVVLTLAYTLWLKEQALIDVLAIGGLFTVRVQASVVLTEDEASVWLTCFAFVLFTSLAMAKRHAELVRAKQDQREIVGRGYRATDIPLTVGVGLATAAVSVIEMLLYLQLDARHVGLYERTGSLLLIPIVLTSWLMRIWVKAHRGELHDDPVVFATKDKISIFHAFAVGLLWLMAVV